jgi:enamine deaminase RidA (YjgF/YER057c/UK114 family)
LPGIIGELKMEKKSFPFFYGGKKQDWGKAVIAGDLVFLSGVSGREFSTGQIKGVDVKTQTRTAWEKIVSILKEVGSSLNGIVKIVIYLRRAGDYDAYYEETCQFLKTHCPDLLDNPPAMTLVETGFYQKEMLVEIDVTAILSK